MIRHASLDLTAAIPPLAIAVIEPAFGALLMTAVGATSLAEPCVLATAETAIALAAITTGTQEEQGAAFTVPANPSPEAIVIVRRRHAHLQAALDNSSPFVAG
jgi:hypothetical protein